MSIKIDTNYKRPSGLTVVKKNKNLAVRWVDTNELISIRRMADGWRTATQEEVNCPYAVWKDGTWRYGDLVLMVMDKETNEKLKERNRYNARMPVETVRRNLQTARGNRQTLESKKEFV